MERAGKTNVYVLKIVGTFLRVLQSRPEKM